MRKKQRTPTGAKRTRSGSRLYPDNDPEWSDLENRYSQINDEMRKLAHLLAER